MSQYKYAVFMRMFASMKVLFISIQTTKTAEQKGFLGPLNDARGRYINTCKYTCMHMWYKNDESSRDAYFSQRLQVGLGGFAVTCGR